MWCLIPHFPLPTHPSKCAGIMKGNFVSAGGATSQNTRDVGNVVVFFNQQMVMPCFLITFEYGRLPSQNCEYHDHLVSDLTSDVYKIGYLRLPCPHYGMASAAMQTLSTSRTAGSNLAKPTKAPKQKKKRLAKFKGGKKGR